MLDRVHHFFVFFLAYSADRRCRIYVSIWEFQHHLFLEVVWCTWVSAHFPRSRNGLPGRWGPFQFWPRGCSHEISTETQPSVGALRPSGSLALTHTENSDPPRRPWVNSSSRLRRSPVNGLHHSSEGEPPNTDFMPSHLRRRSHVGFSFLRRSISCEELEWLRQQKASSRNMYGKQNNQILKDFAPPSSINWNYLLHVPLMLSLYLFYK